MLETESKSNITGLIPDFFHDIYAYLIPGFTTLTLLSVNLYAIGHKQAVNYLKEIGISDFVLLSFAAYVIGKIFEQLGYKILHNSKISGKPKWDILFSNTDNSYTKEFKDNLKYKIAKWLEKQDGFKLVDSCKNSTVTKPDDYFNIIQFYLRERFPNVALYEKKQNSAIVLSRSLSLIFALNTLAYLACIHFGLTVASTNLSILWVVANLVSAITFLSRFHQDKKYHAMYIFESFIATKKLLKSTKNQDTEENSEVLKAADDESNADSENEPVPASG